MAFTLARVTSKEIGVQRLSMKRFLLRAVKVILFHGIVKHISNDISVTYYFREHRLSLAIKHWHAFVKLKLLNVHSRVPN